MTIKNTTITALATTLMASVATADMTGRALEMGYGWSGEDFGGTSISGYVVDLYMEFDSIDDVLLNVYNFNAINQADNPTYFQGTTAAGWNPNEQGGIFTTDVSLGFDSFITIGDTQPVLTATPAQMASGFSAIDPNFGQSAPGAGDGGNNNASGPGYDAGWYTLNPNNHLGSAAESFLDFGYDNTGIVVLIGRFSISGSDGFSLAGSEGNITYNQGVGTDPAQEGFVVVPAPGALALLGVAGLAGRRRRK